MDSEPTHPIVADAPRTDDTLRTASRDSQDSIPSTPNSHAKHITDTEENLRQPHLQTPEEMPASYGLSFENRPPSHLEPNVAAALPSFLSKNGMPGSPNSIDNSDLEPGTLPRYRRSASSENLQNFTIGCGASFLGETSELLLGNPSSYMMDDTSTHPDDEHQQQQQNHDEHHQQQQSHVRERTGSTDAASSHYTTTAPTLMTSSFDGGVDFRTGLSGHRGLNRAKKGPTPRGPVRMMSEHRGIARIRPLRRNSPSSPSLGPRFMPVQEKGSSGS